MMRCGDRVGPREVTLALLGVETETVALFVAAGAATPPVARLAVLRRPALAAAG